MTHHALLWSYTSHVLDVCVSAALRMHQALCSSWPRRLTLCRSLRKPKWTGQNTRCRDRVISRSPRLWKHSQVTSYSLLQVAWVLVLVSELAAMLLDPTGNLKMLQMFIVMTTLSYYVTSDTSCFILRKPLWVQSLPAPTAKAATMNANPQPATPITIIIVFHFFIMTWKAVPKQSHLCTQHQSVSQLSKSLLALATMHTCTEEKD